MHAECEQRPLVMGLRFTHTCGCAPSLMHEARYPYGHSRAPWVSATCPAQSQNRHAARKHRAPRRHLGSCRGWKRDHDHDVGCEVRHFIDHETKHPRVDLRHSQASLARAVEVRGCSVHRHELERLRCGTKTVSTPVRLTHLDRSPLHDVHAVRRTTLTEDPTAQHGENRAVARALGKRPHIVSARGLDDRIQRSPACVRHAISPRSSRYRH